MHPKYSSDWFQSSKRDRFGSSFLQNILSGLAGSNGFELHPLPFDSSVPRALRRADLKKPRGSSKLNIAMINSTFQSIQEIHSYNYIHTVDPY